MAPESLGAHRGRRRGFRAAQNNAFWGRLRSLRGSRSLEPGGYGRKWRLSFAFSCFGLSNIISIMLLALRASCHFALYVCSLR